ncbi:hypothetical protein ACWF0M_09315 [Kribbella sp. NPDC055110]
MLFSVLTLGFEVLENRPDWPVLTIRVDGKNPFAHIAKEWRGFDPAEILGPESPLVPDDAGHEGNSWDLPDIHFEREQYLTEVRRITSDRSWETPRRPRSR